MFCHAPRAASMRSALVGLSVGTAFVVRARAFHALRRTLSSCVHSNVRSSDSSASRPRVVVIAGPTGVGKSALAERLCAKLPGGGHGEIISADSVQVYRGLDIGSAKPSLEERQLTPYHLVDICDPVGTTGESADFTAGDFVRAAWLAIDDVLSRGHTPVVVGGTMMYLSWLVHGPPDAPPSDPELKAAARAEVEPFQAAQDWDGAIALLEARDVARAAKLNRNDWYRLSRALEIVAAHERNGKHDASDGSRSGSNRAQQYDMRCFFLCCHREQLNRRIDQRCERMLKLGLLQETAALLSTGTLGRDSVAAKSIGYRQAVDFLTRPGHDTDAGHSADNLTSSSEVCTDGHAKCNRQSDYGQAEEEAFHQFAVDFCTASRRYAKRQMTWFRSDKMFCWVPTDRAYATATGGGDEGDGAQEDFPSLEARVGQLLRTSSAEFALLRSNEQQQQIREYNRLEGSKLKTYQPQLAMLGTQPSTPAEQQREVLLPLLRAARESRHRVKCYDFALTAEGTGN